MPGFLFKYSIIFGFLVSIFTSISATARPLPQTFTVTQTSSLSTLGLNQYPAHSRPNALLFGGDNITATDDFDSGLVSDLSGTIPNTTNSGTTVDIGGASINNYNINNGGNFYEAGSLIIGLSELFYYNNGKSYNPTLLAYVDVNGSQNTTLSMEAINNGSIQSLLVLGSVYDSRAGMSGEPLLGYKTRIMVNDYNILVLNGDHLSHFVTSIQSTSSELPISGLTPNTTYFYTENGGNPPESSAFTTDSQGYASPQISNSDTYSILGPYNVYSGLGEIIFGVGSPGIEGSGGVLWVAGPRGSTMTLNSVFTNNSNATLNLSSPLIVTDPSVGSFGYIATNGNLFTINAPSTTYFSNKWLPNLSVALPPISLQLLSDAVIIDPTVSNLGIYDHILIGNDSGIAVELTIKPTTSGPWATLTNVNAQPNTNFAQNGIYIAKAS